MWNSVDDGKAPDASCKPVRCLARPDGLPCLVGLPQTTADGRHAFAQPAHRRHGRSAAAAAVHAGDLRRRRRSGAPQAAAGALQPARSTACCRRTSPSSASRAPSTTDESYRALGPRERREVLAPAARRGALGRLRARRLLRARRASTMPQPTRALQQRLDEIEPQLRHPRQPHLLPVDPAQRDCARASSSCAGAGLVQPAEAARALRAHHRREADRPRPRRARGRSTPRCRRPSTSGRSSASITTSARRPCRTSW